jgi:site-specific DNA-methyltransferase (adenine-specific)
MNLEPALKTSLGAIYQADCIEFLPTLADESVELVFADPPFNLGKDYGKGISDSMVESEYLAWCHAWIKESARLLKPGGAFFLYNIPKWNMALGHYMSELGLSFRHWVAIDIKFGLPIPNKLYPSHYSLLYFTNGKPRTFQRPRLPIAVCRHCGKDIKDYGGHRNKLHPDGINLTDVWADIPPVRHAATKRRGANELSIKLLRRVLEIATVEGDLVLDPFGGGGTTYKAAEELNRRWIGCEIGDVDPIVRRLTDQQAAFELPRRGDAGRGSPS